MQLLSLLVAFVLPALAIAQSTTAAAPTSTGGIDSCILSCSAQAAAAAGCASYTDVTCVCTSQTFQTAAGECLSANCTAADQQAALQLQATLCAGVSSALPNSASVAPANGTAASTMMSSSSAMSASSVMSTSAAASSSASAASSPSASASAAASSSSVAVAVSSGGSSASPTTTKSAGFRLDAFPAVKVGITTFVLVAGIGAGAALLL